MSDQMTPTEILDRILTERMKRSVKVEQILQDVADGKRPVLTPDECRTLSLALGTPDEAQTDAQRAMLAAGDYTKEAKRLAQAYADAVLFGDGNDEALAALLAHIQRGAGVEVGESVTCEQCGYENWIMYGKAPAQITSADMLAAAPAPDHFRDAAEMVPAPAEVPMPEPVAYGFGNTAITGHTNRLMMVRIDIPGGDQYAGAFWLPLVLADEAHTYGIACRAAGEAAGYARGLAEAGRDAERYRWLRRHFAIVGTDNGAVFHALNLPTPTHIAPDAAIELDASIDAALRGEVKP